MRFLTISLVILFSICFTDRHVYGQIDQGTVIARVGSAEITVREFRRRFELTPWPGKSKKEFLDVIKEQFLYAIMAEKVLSLEADATGYAEDTGVQKLMDRMERWYAKDLLYNDEVRKAITVSEEDLRQEMVRSQSVSYVSFLYFESPAEAEIVWKLISAGTPFDRITIDNPDHKVTNHEVDRNITVPELLAVVDTLRPGEVAPPIATQYGYYIVKLERSHTNPLITESQFRNRRESLEKNIRTRIEKPYARRYVDEVVGERELEIFGSGLRSIAVEFDRVLERKRVLNSSEHHLIMFDDLDFDEIVLALGTHLDEPVMRVSSEILDVKEILDRLRLFGVWLQKDPDIPLLPQIRGILEDLAVDEILAEEALSRNYLELPEVRSELAMWRSNFTSELYKRDLLQNLEVSSDELFRFYEEQMEHFRRPLLVNVREILVATQAEAHNLLLQLDSGRDFGELARLHSRRTWAAEQNGEFGYFPATLYGNIGRVAATLEIGERYGSIPVPDGFSVIELLDKREPDSDLNQPFEEVEESLYEILLQEKQSSVLDTHINKLLDKYTFSIDYNALESVDVTSIQMFAIRHFGFGGNYPVVPILDRQIGWIFERAYQEFIIP
jgi:parvulin-like peptidyl-prolyl isomerase